MDEIPDTRPRKFVCVLMPFDASFDDIYEFGIRPACEAVGAYCERIDEQMFQENILARIYNQISKADIIVADMTGRNPNVFYETGYAHALNKRVILLTQTVDDIPFDLKHYPHAVYSGSISTLKGALQKRLAWHLNQPDQPTPDQADLLRYYAFGRDLSEDLSEDTQLRTYYVQWGEDGSVLLVLELSVHNPTSTVIDTSQTIFSLILDETTRLADVDDSHIPTSWREGSAGLGSTMLPDNRFLLQPLQFGKLMPEQWSQKTIPLIKIFNSESDEIPVTLRRTSEFGVRDTPFVFRASPTELPPELTTLKARLATLTYAGRQTTR